MHEVGGGGEDEQGCQDEEGSAIGMVDPEVGEDESQEETLGERENEEEGESNIESPGRESGSDPIRQQPVVGGDPATDVTQVSPVTTTSGQQPDDQNKNKPAVIQSDGGLTTKSTPRDVTQVSRETTSVKPTDKISDGNIQLTTSSSERTPASQSDSGVNVNVNVNVNVGGVAGSGSGGISGSSGGIPGEARPRSDDGLYGDCSSLNMPSRFSSFRFSSSSCHPNYI